MFLSVIKDYLVNSTFHGLRFIAEDGRHWTERVFWAVCCLLSWYSSSLLIISSWEAFQNNAISFVVETTYLGVENSFPAVSICESENLAQIDLVTTLKYGKERNYNLDEMMKEIAFYHGEAYYIKQYCPSQEYTCPDKDYKKLAYEIRSPCKDIFHSCKWKNESFDCCGHFMPKETEYGICYTLSALTEQQKSDSLRLVSSDALGLGSLYIELKVPAKMYIHTQSDLPYYNTMSSEVKELKQGEFKRYGITVTDIENDPEAKQLSVKQRSCRFPEENYLKVSPVYSYSACVVECRLKEQLRLCNCTSHFMPFTNESEHCGMEGLTCLFKHHETMSTQKTPWGAKAGLDCNCLPSCEEPEFDFIEATDIAIEDEDMESISLTEIYIYRMPSIRYKRNVVRGRLDMVVSMGGTAGLYVGASLLSFVEFVYYFTMRLYNTRTNKGKGETVVSQMPVVTQVAPISIS